MPSCKKCKAAIETGHSYCSVCLNDPAPLRPKPNPAISSSPPSTTAKKASSSKLTFRTIFAAILILVAALSLYTVGFRHSRHGSSDEQKSAIHPAQDTTSSVTNATSSEPKYDPAAIVAQAEQASRSKDYINAELLLSQLEPADLNQPKTHALFDRVSRMAEAQETANEAAERTEFAHQYESARLGAGMDATIRAQGEGKKTLLVSTPLMSRPLVYQIMNPNAQANSDLAQGHFWRALTDDRTDLTAVWKSVGFERVTFTDGFDQTWSYKLN